MLLVPLEKPDPAVAVDVLRLALVPHSKNVPVEVLFGLIIPFI
jgi:hypothetical protein